jgi:pyrimidine deaminase RibD-like protein
MEVHGGHLLQPHFAKKFGSKHQNQNSLCQVFGVLYILFVFWQFGKILQEVNTAIVCYLEPCTKMILFLPCSADIVTISTSVFCNTLKIVFWEIELK